jgi:adenosylmethionine-8-amino-7-oxononanoate aminotransferase
MGLILRDCGHVLSPPLVLTRSEVDRVVDALKSVLRRVQPTGELNP